MSEIQLILTQMKQILEGISTLNTRLTRIEEHLQIPLPNLGGLMEESSGEEDEEEEGLNSGEAIAVVLALM